MALPVVCRKHHSQVWVKPVEVEFLGFVVDGLGEGYILNLFKFINQWLT